MYSKFIHLFIQHCPVHVTCHVMCKAISKKKNTRTSAILFHCTPEYSETTVEFDLTLTHQAIFTAA